MATEAPARVTGRPRPVLLVAFGVAVVLFLFTFFWPSPPPPPAAPVRTQARATKAAENGTVDPQQLKVRLDSLKEARPEPEDATRDPFRFYQKPPPPPPVNPNPPPPVFKPPAETTPIVPPPPPPPLPIPLKYMALVEGKGVGKVAAFSDCKRTFYGREGDIVDGRYKLIRIGLESVTMSYLDGKGQQTIRLTGQDCIGK
jgi:hypothetical protein